MNLDTPFHRQLLRLRWFYALGVLTLLTGGQVIEHFAIRREGLTFTFLSKACSSPSSPWVRGSRSRGPRDR